MEFVDLLREKGQIFLSIRFIIPFHQKGRICKEK